MRHPNRSTSASTWRWLLVALAISGAGLGADRQSAQSPNARPSPTPIERLGPDVLRIGRIQVDTAKREVSVPGTFTGVSALEFIAVTKNGVKAYESLLELDTKAIDFNVALILIGLDPARGTVPKAHFDPDPPKGDPVELWVEWGTGTTRRRVRAERLIYNEITKTRLEDGPWVYTGSAFVADSNAYLAELEGTLIGFVHTPAPVIESPRKLVEQAYGNNVLHPEFNVPAGTEAVLTVRALPLGTK
jgi:hypothetical protein